MSTVLPVRIALCGAAALLTTAALAGTSTAADSPSLKKQVEVYIVQAVPDSTVSVSVDGSSVGNGLAAKDVVGPFTMAPGKHTVVFKSAKWRVSSSFTPAGANSDVVVHWPADATKTPHVTVYENDMSAISADKGRLIVAHTAVVPPADVRVDEEVLFANIANGEFVAADVPAGSYNVDIVPTGQKGPQVFGPVALPVAGGKLTRVFAIGEPTNGSMDAIVQTLPLRQAGSSAPDVVDAGSAGLVEDSQAATTSPVLWVLGVGGLAATGILLVRRYRPARLRVRK